MIDSSARMRAGGDGLRPERDRRALEPVDGGLQLDDASVPAPAFRTELDKRVSAARLTAAVRRRATGGYRPSPGYQRSAPAAAAAASISARIETARLAVSAARLSPATRNSPVVRSA